MPRPTHIACALFDLDGVVVDSEPLHARHNLRVFHAMGVPATYEDCISLAGKSGVTEIPAICRSYGHDLSLADFTAAGAALGEREAYLDPSLAVYDGLRELLAGLRAAGVRLGLVSTTVSARVLTCLNRFLLVGAFDAIVTGDMVTRRKPDPEPYLTGMRLLGAAPEDTVVFEDSATGVAAGKAAGAYVFGVRASEVPQDVSAADERLDSYVGFSLVPAQGASDAAAGGKNAVAEGGAGSVGAPAGGEAVTGATAATPERGSVRGC